MQWTAIRNERSELSHPRERAKFTLQRRRFGNGTRPAVSLAPAMGVGDRLAHPAARLHSRSRVLYRRAGGFALLYREGGVVTHLRLLDQDLRRLVRHGRGVGN